MPQQITFRQATNQHRKVRLALNGVSGSGKTMSALEIATSIGQRVAVIDSEKGSSELYSRKYNFDICDLGDDTHPAQYIEAISMAENAKYDVIIVDSLSHAWLTELDIVGGQFGNWNKVRPIERALIRKIIGCKAHIICTMRTKTEWIQEEYTAKDGKTKSSPKKVGTAVIQTQGIDYEYDVVGMLDREHVLTIEKTRFEDLDGKIYLKPGKRFADELLAALYATATEPTDEEAVIVAPKQIIQLPSNGHKPETQPRIDRDKWMQISTDELKRLGWTVDKGREHLLEQYKQRSRQLLSDQDLLHFCKYLQSQPTPVVDKLDSTQKQYLDECLQAFELTKFKIEDILKNYPDGKAIDNQGIIEILENLAVKFAKDYVVVTDEEVFDNPEDNVYMSELQVIESFQKMTEESKYTPESITKWVEYMQNIDLIKEEDEAITKAETEGDVYIAIVTPQQNDYFTCILEDFGLDESALAQELAEYRELLTPDCVKEIVHSLAYLYASEVSDESRDEIVQHFKAHVSIDSNQYVLSSIRDWSVVVAKKGVKEPKTIFDILSTENRVYFNKILEVFPVGLEYLNNALEDVTIDDEGAISKDDNAFIIKSLAMQWADTTGVIWDEDSYIKQVVMKNHSLSAMKMWSAKLKKAEVVEV